MDHAQPSRAANAYTARLDRTLKALRDRVKEQEAVLEQLRATSAPVETEPSEDPKLQLRQLRALKDVYTTLTPQEPFLPPRDSPIPGIMAMRLTSTIIQETKETIVQAEASLKEVTKRLDKEKADKRDADLIQAELEARIDSLQETIEKRTQSTPAQIARDMIREAKKRKAHYDSEAGKLVTAFNAFIFDHLAAMLAVEVLGGPVVSEVQDVDEDMLEAAYNTQGKAKRAKPNEDKRQRRIDQIWGAKPNDNLQEAENWDERTAAGTEMRDLTEELLNSLVEADGNGPGSYVETKRESAAARFLVRAKVAQLHPRDARKIRLIDFASEIED